MNKPVSGSEYRKLGVAIEELRVRSQANPNMTVRVNEGSYYTSRMKLVEFEGGTSPTIQAPATGYKWVVVGITAQGTIFVSSGEIKNRAPELPTIEKNMLPLAAIYVGANTTAITEDMIEDIRPFLASGYHPGDHTILDNCDQPNLHPISSITGLKEELDDKATKADLERFSEKIDEIPGTSSAVFTLNNAQTGVPTASSGIMVSRGSELSVGIRFNERRNNNEGAWEFTNDGITWNEFPTALSIDGSLKKASSNVDGVLRLSVDPEDALAPIAVGDNDPRLEKIELKADADNVYTKSEIDDKLVNVLTRDDTYTKTNIDDMIAGKANVDSVYSRSQSDAMLRGKVNVGDVYTNADVDNLLIEKANLEEVYSIKESDAKFDEKADKTSVYTKEEIDALVGSKANKDEVYTKDEVDGELSVLSDSLVELSEQYNDYVTANNEKVNAKANAEDVYTKNESDEKFNSIENNANELKNSFEAYVEDNNVNVAAKADSDNVYTKHEIDDITNTKVDNSEFNVLENNVAELSAALNKTLTDVASSIVTQTEYKKDFKATQDTFGTLTENINEIKDSVSGISETVSNNKNEFDEYVSLNNEEVSSKASQESLDNLSSIVDDVKIELSDVEDTINGKANSSDVYTKDEIVSLLEAKANLEEVYRKVDTYSAEKIQELLDLEVNKDEVYTISQVDNLLNAKADISKLDDYAKTTDVDDKLNAKADKTEIPSLDGYATIAHVENEVNAINDKFDLKSDKSEVEALEARVNTLENDSNDIKTELSSKASSDDVNTALNAKADNDKVYSKIETNAFLNAKASKESVDELTNSLANKPDASTVYTKEEVDALLANMYTKEQVDEAINNAITSVLEQIRNEINS